MLRDVACYTLLLLVVGCSTPSEQPSDYPTLCPDGSEQVLCCTAAGTCDNFCPPCPDGWDY